MKRDRLLKQAWDLKIASGTPGPEWEAVSARLVPRRRSNRTAWQNILAYAAVLVMAAGLFITGPRESALSRVWVKVLSRPQIQGDSALLRKSIPYMFKRREL